MNSRDVKGTSEMALPSAIEGNIELWECQAHVLLRVGAHVVGSALYYKADDICHYKMIGGTSNRQVRYS
jgi:hypothetical protein